MARRSAPTVEPPWNERIFCFEPGLRCAMLPLLFSFRLHNQLPVSTIFHIAPMPCLLCCAYPMLEIRSNTTVAEIRMFAHTSWDVNTLHSSIDVDVKDTLASTDLPVEPLCGGLHGPCR